MFFDYKTFLLIMPVVLLWIVVSFYGDQKFKIKLSEFEKCLKHPSAFSSFLFGAYFPECGNVFDLWDDLRIKVYDKGFSGDRSTQTTSIKTQSQINQWVVAIFMMIINIRSTWENFFCISFVLFQPKLSPARWWGEIAAILGVLFKNNI